MTAYTSLPYYMRNAAQLYVERGIKGGSFLTAVLSNNLVRAFQRADDGNTAAMLEWVRWLHNEAPRNCWGSEEKVAAWIKAGGLTGLARIGGEE